MEKQAKGDANLAFIHLELKTGLECQSLILPLWNF